MPHAQLSTRQKTPHLANMPITGLSKTKRAATLFIILCLAPAAEASNADNWELVSNVGAYGLVGIALTVPAYKKDWQGFKQAGFSIATASVVGLIGKTTIDAERPDKSDNDSFPSNHTANAFASATTLHLRYGWKAGLPAYGIATLVGIGRVESDRHYWKDVIAGAALGSFSAWIFTEPFDNKVRLMPWLGSDKAGITASFNW